MSFEPRESPIKVDTREVRFDNESFSFKESVMRGRTRRTREAADRAREDTPPLSERPRPGIVDVPSPKPKKRR
jgi:hypothetical protein